MSAAQQPNGGCDPTEIGITDVGGNALQNPAFEPQWNLAPSDLKLFTSIGSTKATLVFDGPVESSTGTALGMAHFTYTDVGGTVGASGITAVSHVVGSERVQFTLNNRVSAADIQSDLINIVDGAVRGAGTSGTSAALTGVHAVVLEDTAHTLASSPTEVQKVEAMFLSVDTRPVAEAFAAMDRDNNGKLDGVQIRFDQSVSAGTVTTSSFKFQLRNADGSASNPGITANTVLDFADAPGTGTCALPGGLDARYIYVCIDEQTSISTGAKLEISSDGSLVREILKSGASGLTARPFGPISVADQAAPIVLGVHTADVGSDPLTPVRDGRIDALVLTMSEAVLDSNVASAGFMIRDGAGTPVAASGGKYVAPSGSASSPHLLYVKFPPGTMPNTDALPVISYSAAAGGVKDLAGQTMVAFDYSDATSSNNKLPHATVDKAAPFVVSLVGSVGTSSSVMTFSEPVQMAGTGSAIGASAFSYSNTNNQGAQGISTVSHAAGAKTLTFGLVGNLVEADMTAGGDTVTIRAGSGGQSTSTITDASGNFVTNQAYALTSGAGVKIVSVETLDLFTAPTAASGQSKVANGRIDTLRVTISQPIDDGSGSTCSNLDVDDWRIKLGADERTPLLVETDIQLTDTPSNGDTWTTGSCISRTSARDDAVVYLVFDEDGANNDKPWSTATLPSVTYQNDGDSSFMAALSGGVPVSSAVDVLSVDKARPILVSASGSPGSAAVNLVFSEEVLNANPGDGRITTADLGYSNGNGAGASGIKSIGIRSGSVQPITLNQALISGDIGADRITIPGTLKDAGGNVLRKTSFTGAALPNMPIADGAAPMVSSIKTADADANGFLDHLQITFNEAIEDGTACANLDVDDWAVTYLNQPVKIVAMVSAITATSACNDNDDAVIFIELDEDDIYKASVQNPNVKLGTGKQLKVAYTPDTDSNKIVDLAAGGGNEMAAFAAQATTDGAAPQLLTADGGAINPTGSGPQVFPEAAFRDTDGDGRLDAVELLFSEPISDASFDPNEWIVVDHAKRNGGFSTGATVNDERVLILIQPMAMANTDKVYRVTYDPVAPGMKDLAGNELASMVGASAITEVDGARPNLDSTVTPNPDSVPARSDVIITFSEPVGKSGSTISSPVALTASDFSYQNGNTGANDRAAAISSVTHTAGSKEVTLVLDATLSQSDIDNDVIVLDSIYDLAGNKATRPSFKLSGVPSDTTPPLDVSGLTATGIEVSETKGSIKLEWTTSADTDLAQFNIYIRDGSPVDANDPDGQTGTHLISSGVIGDATTIPSPVRNAAQTVTVTGLDVDETFHFLVISVDTANLPSDGVSASAKVPKPDLTPPSAVTGLTLLAVGGNSATIEVTVPSDNVGVTAFEVRQVLGSTFTTFTDGEVSTFTMTDASGVVITTVPASGSKVNLIVSSLGSDTEYTFGVVAKDAAGNKGSHGTVTATTSALDTTAPVGELVVSSPTHAAGEGSTSRDPTFVWSGLSDDESTITYSYALNQEPTYVVDGTETQGTMSGSVAAETVSFTDVPAGTWYFHVRGESQGGFHATTAHYTILIVDPDVVLPTSEEIASANDGLIKSLKVTRSGSDNILRWTLPTTDMDIAGLQIWRSTSPYTLLVDLPSTHVDFKSNEYTDKGAPEKAKYLMTVYFLDDPSGGQVTDVANAAGYEGKSDAELEAMGLEPQVVIPDPPGSGDGDNLPWWVWLLVAIGIVGIVAVVVIPVALSRRQKQDAGWDESAQWDDSAWGQDAWVAGDEAGADVADSEGESAEEDHYLECPKCDHGFEVHGARPLETTCPNCGVKGVLR